MTRNAISLGVLLLLTSLQASQAQAQCDDVSGAYVGPGEYGSVWIEQNGCNLLLLGWGNTSGVIAGSALTISFFNRGTGTTDTWYGQAAVAGDIVLHGGSVTLSKRPCADLAGLYTRDHDNVTWMPIGQTTCSLVVRTPMGVLNGTVDNLAVVLSGNLGGEEVWWYGTASRISMSQMMYIDFNRSGHGVWWQSSVVPCLSTLDFDPNERCWAGLSPMLPHGMLPRIYGVAAQHGLARMHDGHCLHDGTQITNQAECTVKTCTWSQERFDAAGDGCHCGAAACIANNLGWGTWFAGAGYCTDDYGYGSLQANLTTLMPSCCPTTHQSICTVLSYSPTTAAPRQQCIRIPQEQATRLNLAGCA